MVNNIKKIPLSKTQLKREFQNLLKGFLPQLYFLNNLIGELDFLIAKAKFSMDLGGVKPEINEHGEIKIVEGKHPLLLLRKSKVVPNSIFMSRKKPGLIITGPNAGGKTVFLKMMGLLHLMLQWGLFIPAEEDSTTFIPSKIMAEIGDYQSIGEDASTFSSHLAMCDNFYKNTSRNSLILIDEIMMGTDQEEGSFLAMSFMKGYVDKGGYVAVTTHYSYLKMLPMIDERFVVARVDFDIKSFKPLYKISYGVAGMSFPMEVASFMGVSRNIIEKAENLKEEYASETSKLFSRLHQQLKKAEEQEKLARQKLEEAEDLKETLQNDYQKKIEQVEKERKQQKEELLLKVKELEKEVKEALSQFHKEKMPRILTKPGEKLKNLKGELSSSTVVTDQLDHIEVGDLAEYLPLGITGEVIDVDSEKVKIVYKGKEFIGKRNEFKRIEKNKTYQKKEKYLATEMGFERLDLRGKRLDEAVEELEKKLNELVIKNFSGKLIVVHGHGTGVLKKGIRSYLKEHPLIFSYRPGELEEGGDGVTVIEF